MFESLKKWNPFKFKRNEKSQKENKTQEALVQHQKAQMIHPMQSMLQHHREFSKLFDQLWQHPWQLDPFRALERPSDWFGDFSPTLFVPTIDVSDSKNNLLITAELPGMTKDDVQVSIENGYLVIKGEKQFSTDSEEDGFYRTERAYGSFQRSIPLPAEVDLDNIDATVKKGVLTLKLPKKEQPVPQAKQIEVN